MEYGDKGMISDIDAFRGHLQTMVTLLENMIAEGDKILPPPESIGFCEQARRILFRNLKELDSGLSLKDPDSIVHSILLTNSDLGHFTEYDLSWSRLWRTSDVRERVYAAAQRLIHIDDIIANKSTILAGLRAGE